MYAPLARRAALLVFQFLEQRFFFERAFVELGQRMPRPHNQVNPVSRQKENQHEQHSDGLQHRVAAALANVAVRPKDEGKPDRTKVDDE